ncbi:MAG: trypsin-like peptidase domain-containing protein [Sandaracinaceae bacterium]|nr:trypsin-like peptidase domain-containing protein [Sandaracinaceae bacterium]
MDDARDMIRVRTGQIVLVQDSKGLGTGVVVGPDGWILTNKHVAPSVGPYRVVLSNGLNVHGVGVHQSVHHDLAIMKIGTSTETWVDLEKDLAEDYVVGEEVWAIGHPRGCRFSVARGIISNPHREIDKDYYVQTDVSINPGNSGGPLVDRDGKLVGIVTLMYAHSQGLGFAVPAHTASDYVRQVRRLVRQGVVKIPEALLAQASSEEKAAEDIVRTALDVLTESGGAAIEEEKPEEGYTKILRKGAQVDVKVSDDVLNVRGKICRLGPTERGNAKFLADVLALNGVKLGGASFHLDEDDLYLGVVRPTTGLDTMQAFAAMDSVLHLVETWKPKVNELFFSAMVPGGGAPKQA